MITKASRGSEGKEQKIQPRRAQSCLGDAPALLTPFFHLLSKVILK